MTYKAEIVEDSISPHEQRLTTMEITFPRIVLAEFNTHRIFSRNSASSRAIPVEKQLIKILKDPFIPVYWGVNQPGMQAAEELDPEEQEAAIELWLEQRNIAVLGAVALIGGVESLKDEELQDQIAEISQDYRDIQPLPRQLHKQIPNRLLEPFMWHTAIVTASEWENYYALRANPEAQPEIQIIAKMMLEAHAQSQPAQVEIGQWHLPYIQQDERDFAIDSLIKISAARCARVSYLTHAGQRDLDADIELHDRLASSGHMSPLEHPATPYSQGDWSAIANLDNLRIRNGAQFHGNFRGWHQYRKFVHNEHNFGLAEK